MHKIISLLQVYLQIYLKDPSLGTETYVSFPLWLVEHCIFILETCKGYRLNATKLAGNVPLWNSTMCLKRRQYHHHHSTYDLLETRLPDASLVPITAKATFPSLLPPTPPRLLLSLCPFISKHLSHQQTSLFAFTLQLKVS